MNTKVPLAFVLLAALFLVMGCWDFQGLEQRAYVLMAGIDRTEAGLFRLSLQVQTAASDSPQGGQPGGGEGPYRVLVKEGQTLRAAFEDSRNDIFRELDLTFLSVIVIGEGAAADLTALDWVARGLRVPVTAYIGVARGTAEAIVRAKTPSDVQTPGLFLLRGFSGSYSRSAAIVSVPLWKIFNHHLFTPLEDPYAPAVADQKDGLNWDGLAVFNGPTLAGFLNEDEAAIFNLLQGRRAQLTLTAPLGAEDACLVSLHVQRGTARHRVIWQSTSPRLQIRVGVFGDLRELDRACVGDAQGQTQIERALQQVLSEQIARLIRRLQQLETDPLGFGELARQAAPRHRAVQSAAAWRAVYRDAPIDITANVTMFASGYMK